jgi:hypothetical protein
MGRRGLGTIERLFMGSNSKYCIEEANCNVIILKHAYGPEMSHYSSQGAEEKQFSVKEIESTKKEE